MKRSLAGCTAILVCLALAPSAQAALRFEQCGGDSDLECARVSVPLDRSGRTGGEVSLLVKRWRGSRRPRRPPLVVLSDGAASTATDFDTGLLGSLELINLVATLQFPEGDGEERDLDRDLIVFDQRGTGGSGRLRCPALERANPLSARDAAAECARLLGPRRAFYTTRDSAEDIEAIRHAVGYQRVALLGKASGAKLATAYALRHPGRVERIVLDSPVELYRPDPFNRDSFRATRRIMNSLCRGRCRDITPDPVGDIERLVATLAGGPLRGFTVGSSGRRRPSAVASSGALFRVLRAGDLDLLVRLGSPGAVRSALRGDPAPLLRLRRRAILGGRFHSPHPANAAAHAALNCEESVLPWTRTAPLGDRRGDAARTARRAPLTTWRPFDVLTALDGELLRLCERWPLAQSAPSYPGTAPAVPVLVLSGADDMRTPLGSARRAAARFPKAQVLAVPAVGHSVLESFSECGSRAFTRFLEGQPVARRCPPTAREGPPLPTDPLSLSEVARAPGIPGERGRAVGAATVTLEDILLDFVPALLADPDLFGALLDIDSDEEPPPIRGGGLRGGRYAIAEGRIRLRRVVYVPGVRVSGVVDDAFDEDEPAGRGRLSIRGPGTPDGWIRIRGRRITGRIGGRRVRGRLRFRTYDDGGSARAAGPLRRAIAAAASKGGSR